MFFLFFFFQAEDGIRDGHVTGVQTCALPICPAVDILIVNGESRDFAYRLQDGDRISVYPPFRSVDVAGVRRARSEERRVGKEWRWRRGPDHCKKKKMRTRVRGWR